MRKLFLILDTNFMVNFFAIFATFYTFSSFYNRRKSQRIRTAFIPSGNVSDAGDESETDLENLSNFQSNEESESEVDSETEEEVVEESSSTKNDSESTESIPAAKSSKQSTSAPKTKKKSNLSLESKKFQPPQCDVPDISLKLKVNNRLKTTSYPIDFFNLFCDNNFFVQICQETNFYNVQQSTDAVPKNIKRRTSFKRLKSVTVSEIKQTIGIILYICIICIYKLPNRRMY